MTIDRWKLNTTRDDSCKQIVIADKQFNQENEKSDLFFNTVQSFTESYKGVIPWKNQLFLISNVYNMRMEPENETTHYSKVQITQINSNGCMVKEYDLMITHSGKVTIIHLLSTEM